jgi:hypothetical protein
VRVFASVLVLSLSAIPLAGDFSVIVLPDTQFYSASYPEIFSSQTQWIVDSKDALNIPCVVHEGDVVDIAGSTTQWENADYAMSLLEDPCTTGLVDGIPYAIAPGNHDQPTTNYNIYFGVSRFSGRDYYGGHYGSNNDNSYILFSAEGTDFILICLNYLPTAAAINWADGILQTFSDRKAIVVSHYILNSDGSFSTSGAQIYNALKDNPNLFLMLCGHIHAEARRTDSYNGNTVHTLLANFQDDPNGGNGWLRILEFHPDNNQVQVMTYSPTLNQWQTDDNSEFTLSYGSSVAPPVGFTAYNDMAWRTGQLQNNITRITSPNGGSSLPSSGTLVDYYTGDSTGVTLTITGGSFSTVNAGQGQPMTSGTDAYEIFFGKVTCMGVISYQDQPPPQGNLALTLTGMDPDKKYDMVLYANRGDYGWDRASLVTISEADEFINISSSGLDNYGNPLFTGPDDDSTRLPADNTITGFVARFANVDPGDDGQVVLTVSFDGTSASQYKGKYASAFMLQEHTVNIYDLDDDGKIGYGDVAVMCENWLQTGCDLPGNFCNDDDIVNFRDFSDFALHWLE